MRRHSPTHVGALVAHYAAEEMPTSAIVTLQRQTTDDLSRGEISHKDALRITNLLLTIAIQKLEAVA